MKNKMKEKLKEFCSKCKDYLNDKKLEAIAGKYNIELSTRTL